MQALSEVVCLVASPSSNGTPENISRKKQVIRKVGELFAPTWQERAHGKLRGGWTIGFPVSFSRAEVPPDVRTQKDVKAGVGEARKEG